MKFFSLGLAATAVSLLSTAGCSAPATSDAAANADKSGTTGAPVAAEGSVSKPAGLMTADQMDAATKSNAVETSDDTKTSDDAKAPAAKTSGDAKPDPKYHVIGASDKFGPNAPPDLVKAYDDAKVPPPPLQFKMAAKPRVVLNTNKGDITVELDPKAAPLQVKSFLYLSSIGFFDGTLFHRYVPGFVIQGGDPFTKKPELEQVFGGGGPGYEIPREHNKLKHDKFVFAAARSSDPNSAGSQFYITLDPQPNLDQGDGYTVFGKVVDGKDVVLKLTKGDTLKSAKVQSPPK